jgi:hypothetical protein
MRARMHITGIGSGMLQTVQSTLTRGSHLAHNQRLIDRRKLHAKVRARAIARVNAKRLGRQPPARDKPRDYPLADDSFWAAEEDEDFPSSISSSSRARPSRTRPALLAGLVPRRLPHRRRSRAGARALKSKSSTVMACPC